MGLSASDVLKLGVQADTAGAVKQFDALGRQIKGSLGDAEKQAQGLSGKFGSVFESASAKSPRLSAALDKIGLSGQQAGAAIAAAIPAAGLAAGAALAAFAKKGIDNFQQVALAAGKFADSTGLSVDTASRYVAIADDIGVGAGTIQNAFVKMEKAMGSNKAAFGDLIATTKSGGTDLSQTFLNAVQHLQSIKDPIQRATEASKLFGKGFADVSELINTDAGKIKTALAGVSDAQVINKDELEKARNYRAAMDNLGDSVRDLSISIGQSLVPALADAANAAAGFVNALHSLPGGSLIVQGAITPWVELGKQIKSVYQEQITGSGQAGAATKNFASEIQAGTVNAGGYGESLNRAGAALDRYGHSADAVAVNLGGEAGASEQAAAAAKKHEDALNGVINAQLAATGSALGVSAAQRDFNKAVADAATAQKDGKTTTDDLAAAYDNETQAAISTAQATVTYAQKQAELQGKTLSAKDSQDILISTLYSLAGQMNGPSKDAVIGLIGQLQSLGQQHPQPTASLNDQASGPIKGVKDGLDGLRGGVSIPVSANTAGARASINAVIRGINSIIGWSGSGGTIPQIATGTKSFRGGLALVGELGPELVMLPPGSQVWNAKQTDQMFSRTPPPIPSAVASTAAASSRPIIVNVNGLVIDPIGTGRAIKQAIAAAERAGVN